MLLRADICAFISIGFIKKNIKSRFLIEVSTKVIHILLFPSLNPLEYTFTQIFQVCQMRNRDVLEDVIIRPSKSSAKSEVM